MGSDDNEDPEDFKNAALSRDAGVQRAVWDLRYEGARKIKGGKIDTGDPATARASRRAPTPCDLTAAGKTLTAPLKVVADPRGDLPVDVISRRRPRSRSACGTTSRGSPTWSTSCAPSASS